jgi:enoyl-CoA hydratase/carnithine racemase
MGLNEIKLGVPVPYPADCILRDLVGVRAARDVMEGGEFYPPEALLLMGMVDRICPPEEVLSEAVEKAKTLAALPQEAYAIIKRNRVEPVEEHIWARLEAKERLFVDRWYSEEARERLREAMEKF